MPHGRVGESMEMGETWVTAKVYGTRGNESVRMLVDTGSTLSMIPEPVAKRLGIEMEEMAEVELADGSKRRLGRGNAVIEYEGRRVAAPILIETGGEVSLFGLTTLEALGLKVNTVTNKLEQGRYIAYMSSVFGLVGLARATPSII